MTLLVWGVEGDQCSAPCTVQVGPPPAAIGILRLKVMQLCTWFFGAGNSSILFWHDPLTRSRPSCTAALL